MPKFITLALSASIWREAYSVEIKEPVHVRCKACGGTNGFYERVPGPEDVTADCLYCTHPLAGSPILPRA